MRYSSSISKSVTVRTYVTNASAIASVVSRARLYRAQVERFLSHPPHQLSVRAHFHRSMADGLQGRPKYGGTLPAHRHPIATRWLLFQLLARLVWNDHRKSLKPQCFASLSCYIRAHFYLESTAPKSSNPRLEGNYFTNRPRIWYCPQVPSACLFRGYCEQVTLVQNPGNYFENSFSSAMRELRASAVRHAVSSVQVAAKGQTRDRGHISIRRDLSWLILLLRLGCPRQLLGRNFYGTMDKRVLSGPPRIPYLHMPAIRSRAWRNENGLSDHEAERRVEECIDVICKRKDDPALFSFKFDGDFFDKHIKRTITTSSGTRICMRVDYFVFLGYVYVVLHWVRKAMPRAERVHFLVERNGEVTKNLHEFYSGISPFLASMNRPDLIPLIGEIIPGGKDRSPLQAADVFAWHLRRGSEHTLTGNDLGGGRSYRAVRKCFGSSEK